ncbi:unnamed protein product [Calypogeia fissa]
MKAVSDYNLLVRQRLLHQKDLSVLTSRSLRGVGAPRDWEMRICAAQASVDRLVQEQYCYDAQLLKDPALIQSALMVIRLVGLTGGFKMPLPVSCPMEFASMPEHFIEDCLDLLILAPRIQGALNGMVLDEFMSFCIMFMGSPLHVKNPYLRAKMAEVLTVWIPSKINGEKLRNSMTSLFAGHQLALQYLVPNLLKLYVDIEFTGSHTVFHDKHKKRHIITGVLEYLRGVPSHHSCWKQIAVTEERGAYLKFLNLLINDSIFLLDESLKLLPEVKAMKSEIKDTKYWQHRNFEEREDRTRRFHESSKLMKQNLVRGTANLNMLRYTSSETSAPFLLPEMVERIASMLNYFLMQMLKPQWRTRRKALKLLSQIVDIYGNLGRGDVTGVFSKAVSRDGRSYREEFFPDAVSVLMMRGLQSSEEAMKDFTALGAKAAIAAIEAVDTEALLGDIPDELLDPIQYTLMTDPVILPSSNTSVDRSTIQRHLLSDQTDPFNRSLLTSDMLIPNTELKAKIEEFLSAHKHGAPLSNDGDGESTVIEYE